MEIREMISFELGKEIKKDVFSSCHKRGTKEKILSPREESSLRPSDSALRCSTTEPQRLHGERGLLRSSYDTRPAYCQNQQYRPLNPKVWGSIPHGHSEFFCPTLVKRRKNIFFYFFTEPKKLTISLISIKLRLMVRYSKFSFPKILPSIPHSFCVSQAIK